MTQTIDQKEIHSDSLTYQEFLNLKQYRPNTKKSYSRYERLFIKAGYTTDQLSANRFLNKYNHPVCRAFLRSYYTDYHNIRDIDIIKPKGRKTEPDHRYLTEEKTLAFIDYVYKEDEKVSVMIQLLFETGLRLNEMINLTKWDINLAELTVMGVGKGGKRFKEPISEDLGQKLAERLLRLKDDDYPFKWDGIKNNDFKFWYILKKYGKDFGIDRLHPHILRHSLGHYLRAEKGWDLEQIRVKLRHSDVSTTQRYSTADKKEVDDKIRKDMFSKPERDNPGDRAFPF